MARKKVARKKTSVKKPSAARSTSVASMRTHSKKEDVLCKISLVMTVLFVMSAFPGLGLWVMSVRWWVWLVLALVIGWKPLMSYLRK